MPNNLLVINVEHGETRIALIENGTVAELHTERTRVKTQVGNIYLGKVARVLPGMQSAFVDIGLDKAAFLHVEDTIHPDDFEQFIAGTGRYSQACKDECIEDELDRCLDDTFGDGDDYSDHDIDDAGASEDGVEGVIKDDDCVDTLGGLDDDNSENAIDSAACGYVDSSFEDAIDDSLGRYDEELFAGVPEEPVRHACEDVDECLVNVGDSIREAFVGAGAFVDGDFEIGSDDCVGDVSAMVGVFDGDSPVDGCAPCDDVLKTADVGSDSLDDGEGVFVDRNRMEKRTKERRTRRVPRGRVMGLHPSRVTRETPIRDVLREGREVVVQVAKDRIGTKGPRVTSHISLAGRYIVYMPTMDQIGVSRRIGSNAERRRLRSAIESMRPPRGGLIVRTVAVGLTNAQLRSDIGYLVRVWSEIVRKRMERPNSPCCLYTELDIVLRTVRDQFTDDVDRIVIDDKDCYERLLQFVRTFMPDRVESIELYEGSVPIFDAYGIEEKVTQALSRKIPLPSGGYLVIDQAEALTAIDVNTGRYVGKSSTGAEETILKTNLEAVDEIAYQLRFRNLGGLIVLDMIDMERPTDRETVRQRLNELLLKDKAHTTLNPVSELGLIEMTRKRTRESLSRVLYEPCFYCEGTGRLQSRTTTALGILRRVRREAKTLGGHQIVVNAHPAVVDVLNGDERDSLVDAEKRVMRRIVLVPRREYHIEQFDIKGSSNV